MLKLRTLVIAFFYLGSFALNAQYSQERKGQFWLASNISSHELIIKFQPILGVSQNSSGKLISRNSEAIKAVEEFISFEKIQLTPYFSMSIDKIRKIEERAFTKNTKSPLSNYSNLGLSGIFKISILDKSNENLHRLASAFEKFDAILYSQLKSTLPVPSPTDIPPTTPSYYSNQLKYLDADPGLNVLYAWDQGYKGQGLKLADVEYNWSRDHEEWNDRPFKILNTISADVPGTWLQNEHGSAVCGVLYAGDNGYGVTGIAHNADIFIGSRQWTIEDGDNTAAGVLNAIPELGTGDILLLEFQALGPDGGFVPGEYAQVDWDAVKTAVDAGIIVVATGSNGNSNLDEPIHAAFTARGSTGSIMVGAGSSNTSHDKLSFSTYGSRFDVQGWGQNIASTGSRSGWDLGGDSNQRYTFSFNGTSGAGPMIAGSCALLQNAAEDLLGRRLTIDELRDLLISTGIPQGNGGHIGPFPNLKAAIEKIANNYSSAPESDFTVSEAIQCPGKTIQYFYSGNGLVDTYQWTFEGGTPSSSSEKSPIITYSTNGQFDASLTVSNSFGNNIESKSNYITISEEGNSIHPFEEDFESGIFPAHWSLSNPDNSLTFEVSDLTGYQSSRCLLMNNASNKIIGEIDEIILGKFDLSDQCEGLHTLDFHLAYTKYNASSKDSLLFYASEDCGESWSIVAAFDHNELETVEIPTNQSNAWIPTKDSDWRRVEIDFSNYTSSGVLIKMRNVSGYGSRIWLDQINMQDYLHTSELPNITATLYPVPSSDKISVRLANFSLNEEAKYSIYDQQGRLIQQKSIHQYFFQVPINSLSNGVYLIQFEGKNWTLNRKLVKN